MTQVAQHTDAVHLRHNLVTKTAEPGVAALVTACARQVLSIVGELHDPDTEFFKQRDISDLIFQGRGVLKASQREDLARSIARAAHIVQNLLSAGNQARCCGGSRHARPRCTVVGCAPKSRFARDSPLEEIGFELVVPCRAASRQGPTNCPAIIIAGDDRNYLQI